MSEVIAIPELAESSFDAALAIIQRSNGSDPKQATYLSFRVCYFTSKEALQMAGANQKDLALWYLDAEFRQLDTELIKDFQKLYNRHALTIQYTRNYRMVIQKDSEVLAKSLDPDSELTKFEEQYLTKMRGTYSPEQLSRLTSSVQDGENGKTPLNFLQVVMMANNERSIKVGKTSIIEVNTADSSSFGNSLPNEVCPG